MVWETVQDDALRATGNMERYNIVRNQIQFYNNVAVIARYDVSQALLHNHNGIKPLIYAALKETLNHHPILGVTTEDEDTKEPKWRRLESIDLRQVVQIVDVDPNTSLDALIEDGHHVPFANHESVPLWRIIVGFQESLPTTEHASFALGFFAHHAIADGLSCAAFHSTFLSALNSPLPQTDTSIVLVPKLDLLPALGQNTDLPVSMLFALKKILQTFIYKSPINPLVWSGPIISKSTPRPPRCRVQSFSLPSATVAKLVVVCREHTATITALVTILVAQKLAGIYPDFKRFIGNVPFSMRKFTGHGAGDMGCFVSNAEPAFSSESKVPRGYISCKQENHKDRQENEELWSSARECKRFIDGTSASIINQDVNLLKFVSDLKGYFLEMLGGRRSCAFEVTNIGVIDGGAGNEGGTGKASFDKAIFSSGSCTFAAPYVIHLATAKDGDTTVALVTEVGVIEDEKAAELLSWLEGKLKGLAEG